MIIMGCLIGAIFIVCILCAILRARSSRQRRSRSSRSGPPLFFGTQADFLDEDQGPEINHPTWFIRTVGLQQSVIDSISVFKSHKNCPLCRAPIVCDNFEVQIDLSVPNSSDLNSRGETQIESSENNSGLVSNQPGEDGTSEVRNGDDMNYALPTEDEANAGNSKMGLNLSVLRNHSRVKSDLVDRLRTVETEMQPMGWSVQRIPLLM
ncbi:hypothetical protein GH714_017338 [Hevea brasiliensis]|uniref:Uncharacterized protein n=1 Tax=Hevea brasiliensis TaxID=3981 RepID=A0A6A6K5Y3_HEVBR|nr:hypothetical protein GH714_017338 [Hevea brasiliensis]